jgi:hypothetical protein
MLKWTYPPNPGFDQFLFLSDFWTEASTGGLFDGPPDAAASYGLERFPVLASCVFWTGDIEQWIV